MSKSTQALTTCLLLFVAASNAFAPPAALTTNRQQIGSQLFSESPDEKGATEAVFVPPTEEDVSEDVVFDQVESFGKGSAKKKRGKRKGGSGKVAASKAAKAASTLAPEEVFYEGPPAITETLAPTISILTVVGIIPAAAAWARQAWVRYRITTRRIRVTSGVGGKDMAEIVYPDIEEIRTVKRLFGDGDMVMFLRDGAKFEMRNIPDFNDALEFILKQVEPEVAKKYKEGGDVNKVPDGN